ncbi:MAG: zinc-ribbon domain-containing protein, partial [Clostridia bacterium]|nr:zinc-ribbon domain-containing protein [Clostridia bacterium]
TPVPQGYKFCTKCGNVMNAEPAAPVSAPGTCPNCGKELEAGAMFCTGCGRQI